MLSRQESVQAHQCTNYITERVLRATDAFDVLEYWKIRKSAYPNLSKMARKHLAVCASSTPREGCFSQAPLFIPYLRNRAKPN